MHDNTQAQADFIIVCLVALHLPGLIHCINMAGSELETVCHLLVDSELSTSSDQ